MWPWEARFKPWAQLCLGIRNVGHGASVASGSTPVGSPWDRWKWPFQKTCVARGSTVFREVKPVGPSRIQFAGLGEQMVGSWPWGRSCVALGSCPMCGLGSSLWPPGRAVLCGNTWFGEQYVKANPWLFISRRLWYTCNSCSLTQFSADSSNQRAGVY